MSERAGLAVKKPECHGKDSTSVKSRAKLSQAVDINSPVEQVLHLQRTIGNRAVTRLIQSGVLQAKLKIGQPDDIYEKEADRMAEQVMLMSGESLVNPKYLEESGPLIRRIRFAEGELSCSGENQLRIYEALLKTIRWVYAAKASLEHPEDKNVRDLLRKHFRVGPGDTDKIEQIKEAFGKIAEIMAAPEEITYYCLPEDNRFCQGAAGCSLAGSPNISLCEPFTSNDDIETLAHTVLHEAAHAHSGAFVHESYAGTGGYPGPSPLTNADSYACFARDVSQ